MPTGDEQDDERELEGRILEERGVQVCLHVIHTDEGLAPRERK
ncbi:unannotated protein [freshwater metagenome]|uniref:Unannotated protein n=1 Tax=freshwater metagenome TaxID=449393 RepID=A0A6J6VTB0_9ZZZZ